MKKSLINILAIVTLACSACSDKPDIDSTVFNILFVGNSLTYVNDLPKLVEEEGEKKDRKGKYWR